MIPTFTLDQAEAIVQRRLVLMHDSDEAVRPIIEDVRKRGDAALFDHARRLDGFTGSSFLVEERELDDALGELPASLRTAMELSAANVRSFAQAQRPAEWMRDFGRGRCLGQIVRPLHAVSCYVPSGRYPLPSTLIMSAVPALAAGVREVTVTSPRPSREILGCASLLGCRRVFRLGGAQAIAAFAFGTESICRADRIVGPGNRFVAAAKRLLAGEVGIDFVAGPTEILILASTGDALVIAADMLAQAEHDVDAIAVLVTDSAALAEDVRAALEQQLATLPTAAVAREALRRNGAIVLAPSAQAGVEFANRFAPEHLALYDPSLLPHVENAGTIFLGGYSPEAAGDYAAGPSHVLPTCGVARLRGGLSVLDFLKIIPVQQLSAEAVRELTPAITALARAEGLEAHARSAEMRCVQ